MTGSRAVMNGAAGTPISLETAATVARPVSLAGRLPLFSMAETMDSTILSFCRLQLRPVGLSFHKAPLLFVFSIVKLSLVAPSKRRWQVPPEQEQLVLPTLTAVSWWLQPHEPL